MNGCIRIDAKAILLRDGKTDSVPAKVIDSEITAEEDVAYCVYVKRRRGYQYEIDIPIIHRAPPGKLISIPVNAEIQVP